MHPPLSHLYTWLLSALTGSVAYWLRGVSWAPADPSDRLGTAWALSNLPHLLVYGLFLLLLSATLLSWVGVFFGTERSEA
jgi:hypothetical protein